MSDILNEKVSFVISTRKIIPEYLQHIRDTSKFEDIEFLVTENDGNESLASVYNKGLQAAKNDIVIFCHDDLIFMTPYWGKKLLKHFKRNPDYGIVGLAGTNNLITGQWWTDRKSMHGIVNHTDGYKTWTSEFSKDQGFNLKEMVALDGLFFAVDKKKIKQGFDEEFKGFHFYEIPFCVANYIDGVKIGVITDIRVTHKSVGNMPPQWEENKVQFERKYGHNLPLKIRQTRPTSGKTLINIITRTSNRPNSFNRCCDSIDKQTYKNINHIVCVDNEADIEYVKARGRTPVLVDREALIAADTSPDPKVGPHSPHNLYFNEVQKQVKNGWIVYLDDDDYYSANYALEEIVYNIERNNDKTMFFWRMNFYGNPTPAIVDNTHPPQMFTIGSPCFAYNSKYIKDAIWDGWKCSDYRVIEKLYKAIPNKIFIPETFIMVPAANGGNKKDIDE